MLESLGSIFNCEKKKTNHRVGGMSFGFNRRTDTDRKLERARKGKKKFQTFNFEGTSLSERLYLDTKHAPEENEKLLIWKWDKELDCFSYKGCNPKLKISSGFSGEMDKVFEDIAKVENYEYNKLAKEIGRKKCIWSTIFCFPLLLITCCIAMEYWERILIKKN